jgi:hypothetical protein
MTTVWTNKATGQTLTVTVHEVFERHGETMALVNKGETKAPAVFRVRVADTNLVLA